MELSPLQMDPAPNPTCSDWKEAGFAIGASRAHCRGYRAHSHIESRANDPDATNRTLLHRGMRMLISRDKNSRSMDQPIAGDELRAVKRYPATRTDERPGCSFPSVIHDQLGHYNPKHTAHYACVAGLASRVSGDRGRRRRHRPRFARVVGVAPPDGQAELRQSLIEAKPLSHGRRSTARLRVTNS